MIHHTHNHHLFQLQTTSAFASGTGPRSDASEIVVANVISPERSITAASAVGPSSQGVENTKWSLAETATNPDCPRRIHRGLEAAQGLSLIPELDQRQVHAQFHHCWAMCTVRPVRPWTASAS